MKTIQQFPEWFSKQKPGGKLAVGCGTLFFLFCLCSFSIAVLSPSQSSAKAASTSVDVSSIQTSAFDTAVAGVYQTATASVPTIPATSNIPTFTPSPVPTESPEATIAPTIDLYIILLNERVQAYVDAFQDVLTYHQEVTDDMSLILDTDWKTKQGLALGLLNLQADEMAKLQPSPKYLALHSLITELTAETHLFADAYAKGIDNLDSDQINQALQHMLNMNALMEQATAELKSLTANP